MDYDSNYGKAHKYLAYYYGKAFQCENPKCEGKSRTYHWALIHGKQYAKNRANFQQLCAACHVKYDGQIVTLTQAKLKPIVAYTNFEYLEFASTKEASKQLGILKTSINNALRGKSETAGNYEFAYAV